MSKLVDYAPGTGVFEGDLRYGRACGLEAKRHQDYPAERVDGVAKNAPLAPLVTVKPRDPNVWRKDPKVKQVRKKVTNSQHAVNTIIETYSAAQANLRANITLIVGKTKL
mgnify:CR=1 FL=1